MVIIANGADLTNDFYNDADFTFYNEHIGVSRECRINKTLVVVTFPCGMCHKFVTCCRLRKKYLPTEMTLTHKLCGN